MVFLTPTVDVSKAGNTLNLGNVNASTINIGKTGTNINLNGTISFNGLGGSISATSFTGVTGWTGFTGVIGPTGITGSIGITGITGFTGVTGWTGDVGVTGWTGAIGATGPAGSGSGSGITLTNNNVILGIDALFSNINGSNNNALGFQTLYNNTGSYNSADGYQSLRNNTTGNYNIGLGYNTQTGTTASYSTAIGFNASTNNFSYSTAIGYQAANTNTSQIMLGSGETVVIPGLLNAGSNQTPLYIESIANYINPTSQGQGGGQIMWNYTNSVGELDIIGYSGLGTGGVNLYAVNTNIASYASQTPQIAFSALRTGCGVKTSSPVTDFHVNGTSFLSNTTWIGPNYGMSATNGGGALSSTRCFVSGTFTGDYTTETGQMIIADSSQTKYRLGFGVTTSNAQIQSNQYGVGDMPLLLNPQGGNVGINIISPSYPLDVNGNCYIRDNLGVNTVPSGYTLDVNGTCWINGAGTINGGLRVNGNSFLSGGAWIGSRNGISGTNGGVVPTTTEGWITGTYTGLYPSDTGQFVIADDTQTKYRLGFGTRSTGSEIQAAVSGTGNAILKLNPNGGNVTIGGNLYSTPTFDLTSAATRQVFVGSDGLLGSKASTRETKESIVPLDSSASEVIYQFQPYSFVYKQDKDKSHFHIGYIAEDIALLDKKVTGYETDSSGNETIYSVYYDDIVVYAVAEIKKLKSQIESLTSTVNTLTERINSNNS